MAKQWKHTFSKFYNGETDDAFIPTGDKYLSSYNIEPVLNPRYLELHWLLLKQYALTTTAEIVSMTDIPWWARVDLWTNEAFYNWVSITATTTLPWFSYMGSLYDSSWVLKNYIFGTNDKIAKMNADCSALDGALITKASWTVTAVCQAYNTILFSVWSTIYKIDNAWIVWTALSTIPYGSVIKKLYFFNDILYVFTQLWADTIIYQASYNGTAWTYGLSYRHIKEDVSIYDMAWSGWKMYWISNLGLYQTNWTDSQLIKNISFTSWAKCSFYKDSLIYIVDTVNIYRFWTNLVWFPNAFVKLYTHNVSIVAVLWRLFFEARTWWESDLLAFETTRYASTGEIVTMPYDSGVLWAEKNLDVIDFPYELKTGKTWASIQIKIQTNLMELDNPTTYINIKTLSDISNSTMRCRIDRQEILTALSSENPNWQYARFKIILNWGLPDGSSRMQYSPKVYQDILIAWEFINDAETYL